VDARTIARWLPAFTAAFALFVAAPRAHACAICSVAGTPPTPAQQLINTGRVLIVAPDKDRWTVAARVKGPAGAIPDGALGSPKEARATGPVVVAQDAVTKRWDIVGPLGPEHASWLARVATTKRPSEMTDADWREAVGFYAPYLEHPDPFIAETAYGEIARAPYAAMRTLKPMLDPKKIGRWLDDQALAARRPLYTLLLGIAGGPDAAARVDRSLADAAPRNDASNIAALLCADLELRGPSRLAWVETAYLTTRARSMQEVQGALLALSAHGGADGVVPRARIVETYRTFIRSHHPLAGSAAPDLLEWRSWDAVPDYIALLKAQALQYPIAELALLHYLDSSPRADAKAAVAAHRLSRR
jgi:hypothetical protein